MFEQVIPFSTSKGGNVPNMCLANVINGFGVLPKYPDAWTAWENTQQHSEAIPDGLDVPVFFSYSATIDGVDKNWGHIGVRLANGQFWSDGNIYSDINAYLANHLPKYVGWGESVNNVTVIKGEDMIQDSDVEFARWAKTFQMIRGRAPSRAEFQASGVGQTWLHALEILEDNPEADATSHAQDVGGVAVRDNWEQQIYDLEAQVASLKTQLESVPAPVVTPTVEPVTVPVTEPTTSVTTTEVPAVTPVDPPIQAPTPADVPKTPVRSNWVWTVINWVLEFLDIKVKKG